MTEPQHGAEPTSSHDAGQDASQPQRRGSRRMSRNERRSSTADYDTPATYHNIDGIYPPVENTDGDGLVRQATVREDRHHEPSDLDPDRQQQLARRNSQALGRIDSRLSRRRSSLAQTSDYNVPDQYTNLDELAASSPVQNPEEAPVYRHESLEDARSRGQDEQRRRKSELEQPQIPDEKREERGQAVQISRLATQIYTLSYLVLFSILGTLARLGLQALTYYPGAPVIFSSIWPNFAGSLVMGFLAEDRMLFSHEWGVPTYANELQRAQEKAKDEESGSDTVVAAELAAAKKAHAATKKTIPLYIGLATGFCGSFTSFSSFIRDVFLALSNDLTTPGVVGVEHRNGGYSFMALIAVVLLTVSMSLSGLFIGAHLAIATEPIIPAIPYPLTRKVVDRIAVILGWGCWIGAVILSSLPPDRDDSSGPETWRGRATFALVFAPLGCLVRFYTSLYLNGKIASFPLGTFAVNVFGTGILAMAWVLAHVPLGGVVGCQVLQGIEDGFCGCLTTISTWVAELSSLRRRHAYTYGAASVLAALALMVAIMGGLRWSRGFEELQCLH